MLPASFRASDSASGGGSGRYGGGGSGRCGGRSRASVYSGDDRSRLLLLLFFPLRTLLWPVPVSTPAFYEDTHLAGRIPFHLLSLKNSKSVFVEGFWAKPHVCQQPFQHSDNVAFHYSYITQYKIYFCSFSCLQADYVTLTFCYEIINLFVDKKSVF